MKKIILICALFTGLIFTTSAFAAPRGSRFVPPHNNLHVAPHGNYRGYGWYSMRRPFHGGNYYPFWGYYNYQYATPYFVQYYTDVDGITYAVYYNPVTGQYSYYPL